MVELDIVYDHHFRKIMNEFGALIEKRGVVLVTFNNEVLGIVQARALTEIFRQSANEITGLASGFLHNPGKQRRSGCFAVRSRDYEVVTAPQKIIFQNFRQGEVKQFSIQY